MDSSLSGPYRVRPQPPRCPTYRLLYEEQQHRSGSRRCIVVSSATFQRRESADLHDDNPEKRIFLQSMESYSYISSRDGKYLIRQDNRTLLIKNIRGPVVHSLTTLMARPDEETATPIDIYQVRHSQVSIRACSFPPPLPLAIFSLRGFGSKSRIMVLYFGAQSEMEPLSKSHSVELTTGLFEGTVQDGDLQFSSCRTQVIVWVSGPHGPQIAPVVIALEQNTLHADIARLLFPPKAPSDLVRFVLAQTHEADSIQPANRGIKDGQLIMAEDSSSNPAYL